MERFIKKGQIIVGLDFDNADSAFEITKLLNPENYKVKVGNQLFTACGPTVLEDLSRQGFDIFLDLKYHDTPNTVEKAILEACKNNVWMTNIHLSGGQKRKLVLALALLSKPKVLLLDEPFAALDVLTIKMLQEIIVNLQQESQITICICDHQARDLLACVDGAMILSNGKIVAQDTPSNLVQNINARNAYFGEGFKIN